MNLWLLLRDEVLRFVNEYRKTGNVPAEGLTLDDIDADIGIRWIKVSLADDKVDEAEGQIRRFRETCPDLVKPGSYSDFNLTIWEVDSGTYGSGFTRAQKLLDGILEKEELLSSKTSLDKWRIDFLQAYQLYMKAISIDIKGNFKQTVGMYRQAVPLWRGLKFELQAATNLNDLAWVEAEVGDFRTATTHCNDGLHLRRKLGRRYLIGLSLNTLGLIETRRGSPERARFHCEQALDIFRETEDAWGIGLACIALAESLRRMTNTDLLSHEQIIEHLKNARTYAEEAVKIFSEQVTEPLRLVEAHIEVGCVYREWARHLLADDPDRLEKVKEGQAAYSSAMEIAEDSGYEYRAIDALGEPGLVVLLCWGCGKGERYLKRESAGTSGT